MSESSQRELIEQLIQLHARQIGEHVDTVQIFVTKQSDGGETTIGYNYGTGNFFARSGQVGDWVIAQEEYVRENARISQRKDLE